MAVQKGLVQCVLTPQLTQGPYYVPGENVRHDITEGKRGALLYLALRVPNAATCGLVGGAAVDIWHCDALGVYSGAEDAILRNGGSKGMLTVKQRPVGYGAAITMGVHA